MSLVSTALRDRRLIAAFLVGVLALAVGYAVPPGAAIKLVARAGYWVILILFALFIRACWRAFGSEWRQWRLNSGNAKIAALIAAAGLVLVVHERHGYKILADELLLSGTAMGMHYQREAAYPTRATDVQGPFMLLDKVLDKRPFFFPFLVSIVHDLTGYRPANAFYLNTALGFAFLGIVFVCCRRLGGSAWAGLLGVLLFAGLPLLAQQVTGGGFDLLNIVMIAAVLWLALRFAEAPEEKRLEPVCLGAGLLAFTRYESVLFLLPVALLLVWGWCRTQRVILTWPIALLPGFLCFYLLQNRVFSVNAGAWELASRPEATTPFGPQYLPDNLGHALAFFFDTTGYQPNSPVFAAIGLLALPLACLWMVRVWRSAGRADPVDTGATFVFAGLFAIGGLHMVYFYGQFDDPLIRRLSLPVHLLMVLAIAVVVRSTGGHRRVWQVLCSVAGAGLLVYSVPAMAQRAYAHTYSPAVEMEWRGEFLKRFPERDYLFIDNDTYFWIVNQVAATPIKQAQVRKEGITFHLRNHTFSGVYVFQSLLVDDKTGHARVDPEDELGPDYELETVWEKRIQTLLLGRISRVVSIREGGSVAARAGMITPVGQPPRTAEEIEAAKKAFTERWLKQLP